MIFRSDDILSRKKAFSISKLRDLPLICSKQWVDHELPDWFEYNLKDVNIVATYNLPYNGAIMAKARIGYAIMLDKLVPTDNNSEIIFRPLKEAPNAEMFIIWRKNQVFTPIAGLLIERLKESFGQE